MYFLMKAGTRVTTNISNETTNRLLQPNMSCCYASTLLKYHHVQTVCTNRRYPKLFHCFCILLLQKELADEINNPSFLPVGTSGLLRVFSINCFKMDKDLGCRGNDFNNSRFFHPDELRTVFRTMMVDSSRSESSRRFGCVFEYSSRSTPSNDVLVNCEESAIIAFEFPQGAYAV